MKDYQPYDRKCNNLPHPITFEGHAIPIEKVPVSGFVYLLFVVLMKFPLGPRGDKTHWAIPFKYKDVCCEITFEKFGIRLYIEKRNEEDPPTANWKEIIDKINRAILFTEKKLLAPLATEQLAQGNVTVANHYHRLDNMRILGTAYSIQTRNMLRSNRRCSEFTAAPLP